MNPPPPSAKSQSLAVRPVLTGMLLVQAFATFGAWELAVIAPRIGEALSVSPGLIGYQIAISYAGAMVTSLMGGPFSKRFGATRTSQLALTLVGCGSLIATWPSLLALAFASLMIGFGYGLTNPSAAHLLARARHTGNHNLIVSIKQTGVPLGGILAGLVTPRITETFGWQWALATVAVTCVSLVLVLQLYRRRWDDDRDRFSAINFNPFSGLDVVWQFRRLRLISFGGWCYAFVQMSFATYLVTMLVSEVGMSLVEAGVILSIVQAGGIAGRLGLGYWADRLGNGLIVLLTAGGTSVLAAIATVFLDASWPFAAMVALFAIFGVSALGWNGVFLAESVRSCPIDKASRATGAGTFFTFGGVLIGPSLFALVHEPIGSYTGTFVVVAIIGTLGIAMYALALRLDQSGRSPSRSNKA
jgi:MFS family permease